MGADVTTFLAQIDELVAALNTLRADLEQLGGGEPITVTLDGTTWSGYLWKTM